MKVSFGNSLKGSYISEAMERELKIVDILAIYETIAMNEFIQ
jgi:hypothetical protein